MSFYSSLTGSSAVSAPLIEFYEYLNDISPATFNRIAGLTSNAQVQLDALDSRVTAIAVNDDDVWEGSVQQLILTPENQLGPTVFLGNIRQTAPSVSNILGDTKRGNLTLRGKSIVQTGSVSNELNTTSISHLTVTNSWRGRATATKSCSPAQLAFCSQGPERTLSKTRPSRATSVSTATSPRQRGTRH
jgi:hypothetical protein